MSGGHGGSGGVQLAPAMYRIFRWGLLICLGPGVLRALYEAIKTIYGVLTTDNAEFNLGDFLYKFLVDMNFLLAPAIFVWVPVWVVAFVLLMWFNLL